MDNIVYSTDKNWQEKCENCDEPKDKCICENNDSQKSNGQIAHIRREKKGRAGKTVTTISNLRVDLKNLQRELQKHCATGGSTKNGIIEIQGDLRDKISKYLQTKGFKVKFIDG